MGDLTQSETPLGADNLDLRNRIKHPQCVDKVVAELSDGTEIEAGFTRPKNLVAYRIEYKVGPCMDNCPRVIDLMVRFGVIDYAEKGCYNGRIDRVKLSDL